MTSSNGSIFRVNGPLCGISPVTGEFPSQWPVTRSFDCFCDLRLNSKQLTRRWFETASRSLWRHCNVSLAYVAHEEVLVTDDINQYIYIYSGSHCWHVPFCYGKCHQQASAKLYMSYNEWFEYILIISEEMLQNNIDGLMEKRRNSITNALGLRIFCVKPSICSC